MPGHWELGDEAACKRSATLAEAVAVCAKMTADVADEETP